MYLVSELRALQKPTLCLSQTQTHTLLRKQKWEQKGFVAKAYKLVTSMPVQSEPWSGGPSTRAGLITTSSNFLSVKKQEKVLNRVDLEVIHLMVNMLRMFRHLKMFKHQIFNGKNT